MRSILARQALVDNSRCWTLSPQQVQPDSSKASANREVDRHTRERFEAEGVLRVVKSPSQTGHEVRWRFVNSPDRKFRPTQGLRPCYKEQDSEEDPDRTGPGVACRRSESLSRWPPVASEPPTIPICSSASIRIWNPTRRVGNLSAQRCLLHPPDDAIDQWAGLRSGLHARTGVRAGHSPGGHFKRVHLSHGVSVGVAN